jgi:ketosteroid isomerase-like protein
MSEENVEIVRRSLAAWQRDDFEAWVALIHPDIEWHEAMRSRVEGEGSVFRGHQGMREFWAFWRTQVEDFQAEVKDTLDLGDDRVLQLLDIRWRGTASGITLEGELALLMTLRDGRISRSVDYLNHAEALEAAGLSE